MTGCDFCRPREITNKNGKFWGTSGKPLYEKAQFYDDNKNNSIRKQTRSQIISPDHNQPRLKVWVIFKRRTEMILNIPISYCPRCGRYLKK